ncbi:MFS transporter [Labrys miyagiensis]|uniref:MFS transporter n=1 Tax=Labrys miyagiensis TaxID=346912 RepID=A0ABQ6CWE7_9HYPH|nr:MFS transporter [Labrys miyagiensis]GLS24004.1 MFS transporter [Labrys miyagiensis]
MQTASRRPFGQNYAFVVVGVIFLSLLVAAGVRAAPGLLIQPLHRDFGWSVDIISLSGALGILLYGLVGPFAAALMNRFGVRQVLVVALLLMALSIGASLFMTQPWHLIATWGVLSGLGSGCVAMVLGATVVNRWFTTNRGLIMGLLSASAATGTLIFQPGLAKLGEIGGWPWMVSAVALGCAILIPLALFLVPNQPSDIGQRPYGTDPSTPIAPVPLREGLIDASFGALARAAKTRTFWYLFATFFICGFTTNGLVGMHLVSFCGDMGIPQVQAASLMAMMGIFDLFGTTFSGWLTDRFDPRKLLFLYYGLRGLALIYLPFSGFNLYTLTIFGIFYGLDWIATVPPTLRLTNEAFGDRDAPVVFGWIAAGHQIGAASAAALAGYLRVMQGSYVEAFVISGLTGIVAALIALLIARRQVKAEPALA